MNFTKDQHKAIYERDKNIIVSAGAGSGKTAVLIERIYTLIIEKKVPVNKLLILTFTNAASKEMKNRLYEKLSSHIENYPDDKFISKQIKLLPLAQISTMHSFCKNILQENFQLVNIAPNFKIGNQSYLTILKNQSLDEIFDRKYEDENKEFLSLVDIYSDRQSDDNLKELILNLYDDIQNKISPIEWLKSSILSYELNDISSSMQYKKFISNIKNNEIEYSINLINSMIETCIPYDELNGYRETFEDDKEIFLSLNNALQVSYDKFIEIAKNIKFPRLKSGKKQVDEYILEIKENLKNTRDLYKKIKDSIEYQKTIDQTNEENKIIYPVLKELVNIIEEFDKIYKEKKKEADILSFSDLEHNMLEILSDETTRKKISEKYDYIFYDEYQDSNTIHNEIINRIKKNNNLFFVGDVKQSIYGFRNAEPKIFIETYENYNKNIEKNTKIDLSENFRSSKQVIDFINFIFENIMSKNIGDIDYDENAKLKTFTKYKNNKEKIGITLIEKNDENPDNMENEAIWTANKIKSLIGKKFFDRKTNKEKTINYGDIAVLFRSPSNIFETYKKVFKTYNIPFYQESSIADFEVIEMGIFIDLLKIIDNFFQDDPLLAVMTSVIGGFNIEEITTIRISSNAKYFYEAVINYTNKETNNTSEEKNTENITEKDEILVEKIENFIKKINQYSEMEKIMSLSDFIKYVLKKSEYKTFISILPQGNQREKNLNIIINTAEEFEQNKNSTLYSFLIYLDKILKNKQDLFANISSSSGNMVRLMSIHKSKGLEFPVVFVNSLGKRFNKKDENKKILTHSLYGLGVNYYNTNLNTEYTTIQKEVIKNENSKKNLSEEMRILYVALTRAKDYLFLVGSGNSKSIENLISGENNKKPLEKMSSFLDWIFKVFTPDIEYYQNKLNFDFDRYVPKVDEEIPEIVDKKQSFLNSINETEITENTKKIIERFNYKYPYEDLIHTKVKDSVTNLSSDDKNHENFKIEKLSDFVIKSKYHSKDFTKIGTLTHLVLQNIDYKKEYTAETLNILVDSLIKKELILDSEKSLIDLDIIINFLNSNLAKRIKNSQKIYKEQAFITKYENHILNGVIDLFFIENNHIILIDFKTDNVNDYNLNERINHYTKQIKLYKYALENAYSMPVIESYLYFLRYKNPILIK